MSPSVLSCVSWILQLSIAMIYFSNLNFLLSDNVVHIVIFISRCCPLWRITTMTSIATSSLFANYFHNACLQLHHDTSCLLLLWTLQCQCLFWDYVILKLQTLYLWWFLMFDEGRLYLSKCLVRANRAIVEDGVVYDGRRKMRGLYRTRCNAGIGSSELICLWMTWSM